MNLIEKASWVVFATLSLIILLNVPIGELEGRVAPVTSPVLLELVEKDEASSLWSGKANKLRDCEFVALNWYLGPQGGRKVQVDAEFLDPPKIRGVEAQFWEGLLIGLPARSVLSNSHAFAIHQCPWRPWFTRTLFFSSSIGGYDAAYSTRP